MLEMMLLMMEAASLADAPKPRPTLSPDWSPPMPPPEPPGGYGGASALPPPPPMIRMPTPIGDRRAWVTNSDYPSRARREQREGAVRFRVQVGIDGRASSCTITASSGSADLDQATCSLVRQRARFKPAQDYRGRPTVGVFASAVRWVLPPEGAGKTDRTPAPRLTKYTPVLDPHGTTIGCQVEFEGGRGINITGGEICELRLKPHEQGRSSSRQADD